jgi:putrescine aminotransferase
VRDKGDYLQRHLRHSANISFCGQRRKRRGLLTGIELVSQAAAAVVCPNYSNKIYLQALLLNHSRVIKLQPPFIITYQEIDYLIAAMENAMKYAREFLPQE